MKEVYRCMFCGETSLTKGTCDKCEEIMESMREFVGEAMKKEKELEKIKDHYLGELQ